MVPLAWLALALSGREEGWEDGWEEGWDMGCSSDSRVMVVALPMPPAAWDDGTATDADACMAFLFSCPFAAAVAPPLPVSLPPRPLRYTALRGLALRMPSLCILLLCVWRGLRRLLVAAGLMGDIIPPPKDADLAVVVGIKFKSPTLACAAFRSNFWCKILDLCVLRALVVSSSISCFSLRFVS